MVQLAGHEPVGWLLGAPDTLHTLEPIDASAILIGRDVTG